MGFWKGLVLTGLVSTALGAAEPQYPDYKKLGACPGYKADHVQTSDHGLTADLTLAGKACNVYGRDLNQLTLEVTYETGKLLKPPISS